MNSSTTTPTPAVREAPSTDAHAERPWVPRMGDVVLVAVDDQIYRPLIVVVAHPDGSVSGPICCEAGDYMRPAFRGWESGDGARVTGHPTRVQPFGYGELLTPGRGIGRWTPRPGDHP